MDNSEKIVAMSEVWDKLHVTAEEFELVSGHLGKSCRDYAVELYDESVALGNDLAQHIDKSVRDALSAMELDRLVKQDEEINERNLLRDCELSETTKWRISKLPHGKWEEAIRKSLGRRKPLSMDLSIINSKEANELFLGEEGLGFLPMVIFSMLCRIRATRQENATFRDIWRITHGNSDWRHCKDYDNFVKEVSFAVMRLDNHFATPNVVEGWVYAISGDEILMRCNPQIWKDAVAIHHVVDLKGMLGGRSHLDWLHKAYIARWVRISGNDGNSMRPTILLSRMNKEVGACSKMAVEGYLSWLASQGLVGRPAEGFLQGNAINWITVRREDKC